MEIHVDEAGFVLCFVANPEYLLLGLVRPTCLVQESRTLARLEALANPYEDLEQPALLASATATLASFYEAPQTCFLDRVGVLVFFRPLASERLEL